MILLVYSKDIMAISIYIFLNSSELSETPSAIKEVKSTLKYLGKLKV